MKNDASVLDLFEDVSGLGGPDEGFWVFIVVIDVDVDGSDEFLDAGRGRTMLWPSLFLPINLPHQRFPGLLEFSKAYRATNIKRKTSVARTFEQLGFSR
jgi:hypothetical protein